MRITIAERYKPFSHTPGITLILPRTQLRFQIFPALIKIFDLSQQKQLSEVPVDIQGPVEGFTAQQDLEKECLHVWGHAQKGYFRYRIEATANGYTIINEKGLTQFSSAPSVSKAHRERLSFGVHKAQDYDMIYRRCDMKEVFPLWFRLGQMLPEPHSQVPQGTTVFLTQIREAIENKNTVAIVPLFKNLFQAGFDTGLSPRLVDTQHHGFQLPDVKGEANPLQLLVEGAQLIRKLLVSCDGRTMELLPVLAPEFHCGRIVDVKCAGIGVCDIEWSKKCVRRVVLRVEVAGELRICCQKDVKRFRVNKERFVANSEVLLVNAGEVLCLDHFEA